MRAIMVMYDSLNRHMLTPYGCNWTHTPNFQRLAEHTVQFNRCYVGSMPCMPARRELHTGRLNFLHRSWGPLEPYDDSMPEILKKNGIHSHLVSDHHHYWEEGGANYHTKYSTWQCVRGQEGDPWAYDMEEPIIPDSILPRKDGYWVQNWKNRREIRQEAQTPQAQTFAGGLDFLERNLEKDHWFLQIEAFDPHEPFVSPESYKSLYRDGYAGRNFDWTPYRPVEETPEEIGHIRNEYAALLSMCDHYLGMVLDVMDEFDMWKDTMLIVNTDHGHMLSEHDWWGKCTMPMYEEIAHTPLFIWDPRSGRKGVQTDALVQTIDLAPTILSFFNIGIPKDMLGIDLAETLANDAPAHDAVLFGIFGGHINVTDGRYVYMRAPNPEENGDPYAGNNLFNYTLMPAHIRGSFSNAELQTAELVAPFSFTKGIPLVKTSGSIKLTNFPDGRRPDVHYRTELFDLNKDPGELTPIYAPEVEAKMTAALLHLMKENDAPEEQYTRIGLTQSNGL